MGDDQTMMEDRVAGKLNRVKFVTAKTKALADGRIHAIVSSENPDRDGDIIRVAGWNLDHFMKHPVLVSSHNYRDLTNQIGKWEDMAVKGKRLEGVAKYYVNEGNPQADWGHKLASMGEAAFSVGFIPDMEKAKVLGDEDTWFPSFEFNGQELLEVSHVVVPANADALQFMKGLGGMDPEVDRSIHHALRVCQASDDDTPSSSDTNAKALANIVAEQVMDFIEFRLYSPEFIAEWAGKLLEEINVQQRLLTDAKAKVDAFNNSMEQSLRALKQHQEASV